MKSILAVSSILAALMLNINFVDSTKLSRRKRYVAFPEGATLSIAICMTAQTILRPSEIFTEGLNWGISYDLPNGTSTLRDLVKKPKYVMQRRHRRDLYRKMELIMDSMGYDGRTCIYKALCEAGEAFRGKDGGYGVVEKILKIVFGFPQEQLLESEPSEHRDYQRAHKTGKENGGCTDTFIGCPFSLLDLALGHYSESPFNFST